MNPGIEIPLGENRRIPNLTENGYSGLHQGETPPLKLRFVRDWSYGSTSQLGPLLSKRRADVYSEDHRGMVDDFKIC